MKNFSATILAIAMVSAALLLIAGAKLIFNQAARTRGVLMIVAAFVIIMNVMIWTV